MVKHPDSVVLPLLLPDSPVAVWWPTDPPADPAEDPLGQLAQRRITDSANVSRGGAAALRNQCKAYTPGNTDLAWTRLTPWRALLAAALDQHPLKVTGGHRLRRAGEPERRPAHGVAAQPAQGRGGPQDVEGARHHRGRDARPPQGPIRISRPDGRLATYSSPGHPDRPIALRRRDVHELLSEELRRLDEDDVYAAVAKTLTRSRSL